MRRADAAMAIALICALPALHAAEGPCPTRHVACWEVRLAVNRYGEDAAAAHAKACGWPEAKIAEARKCLK
jgi:hypothetical protein